jgi:HEAT repeat protein
MQIQGFRPSALFVALLLAACSSTAEVSDNGRYNGPWVAPSPLLQQQLDSESERLPWTRDIERLELIRWFAAVGEPGYVTLLELAADPRDEVAASALSALGATGDRRLVPHIHKVPFKAEERSFDLRLERARTLLRLGDWTQVPELIRGLQDDRLLTRALSIQALREATSEDQDYDAKADRPARERAVERWKRWWLAYSGDPMQD